MARRTPTLSREQFDALVPVLFDPENDSPEAQMFRENPELRAEAQRLAQEFMTVSTANKFEQSTRGLFFSSGATQEAFLTGGQDAMYGLTTFGLDLVRAVTPTDSSFNQKLTDARVAVNQQRRRLEEEHDFRRQQTLGQQPWPIEFFTGTAPEFAGEVTPFLLNPATATNTLPRLVAWNTLMGGTATTALDKDAESLVDRAGEFGFGAGFGAALSAALGTPGALRARAARRMRAELQSELSKSNLALEKEVQRITGNEDFSFSLGEVTGNPFIIGLENAAARETTRVAQNKRIETLIDALKLKANRLSPGANIDDIAINLNQTIRKVNKDLQATASQNYSTGMNNIVDNFGDDVVIDGRHYLSEAQRLLAEYTDPTLGGSAAPKFLVDQIDELDKMVYPATTQRVVAADKTERFIVTRKDDGTIIGQFDNAPDAAEALFQFNLDNGGLNAETTSKLLQSFRRIASGEVPVFEQAAPGSNQNLSLALKKAMLDSFDDASVRNPDAVQAIQSLRKIYQFDQSEIAGVNARLIAGTFGVDDASQINARTAWEQLRGRSETAQRGMATILEELNPALLDDIRAESIRDVVRTSFVPAQRTTLTPYSPVKLADALADKSGQSGGAFRGLFPPREVAHMRRFGEALRTINETYLTRFEAATATELRDAGINVVSRSPEFFTRWMVGLLSRGKSVERMLTDPAFRESIIQAADSGLIGPKANAAMIYMVTTAAQWAAADEAEARRKAKREANVEASAEFAADPARAGTVQ